MSSLLRTGTHLSRSGACHDAVPTASLSSYLFTNWRRLAPSSSSSLSAARTLASCAPPPAAAVAGRAAHSACRRLSCAPPRQLSAARRRRSPASSSTPSLAADVAVLQRRHSSDTPTNRSGIPLQADRDQLQGLFQTIVHNADEEYTSVIEKEMVRPQAAATVAPRPMEFMDDPAASLPMYSRNDMEVHVCNSAGECNAAIERYFLPRLLPFCPPEIRDKGKVTSGEILKVFEDATGPLVTAEDDQGNYRVCVGGLDTEGQCVVLIQLSIGNLAIIHRSWAMAKFPIMLKTILGSRGILKAGVGITGDGDLITKHHLVAVRGCLDLRNLAYLASLAQDFSVPKTSLRGLTAQFLAMGLSKRYQTSNFSARTLTREQVWYAGLDAVVGEDLYHKIMQHIEVLNLDQKHTLNCLSAFVDLPTVVYGAGQRSSLHLMVNRSMSRPAMRSVLMGDQPLVTKRTFSSVKTGASVTSDGSAETRKTHYDSHVLLDLKGDFLAHIDQQRLQFYLSRNLADLISGDPKSGKASIQLRFQPCATAVPSSMAFADRCVVCGKDAGHLTKKSIMPDVYRKCLPVRLKAKMCFDIVLLCSGCSQRFSLYATRLISYFEVSRDLCPQAQSSEEVRQVCAAGRALTIGKVENFRSTHVTTLRQAIANHFGVEEAALTDDQIQQACDLIPLLKSSDVKLARAKELVEKLEAENPGGLEKFMMQWRRYFLDMMQPKHLPDNWSVTLSLDERLGLHDDSDRSTPAKADSSNSST